MEEILADSDSDLEGMDIDEPRPKRKVNTWIQEDVDNIVDFTDPSAVSKISATRPGVSAPVPANTTSDKDRGFKTASDGRLIIMDDSDDEEPRSKKNFIKLNSDTDDSGTYQHSTYGLMYK